MVRPRRLALVAQLLAGHRFRSQEELAKALARAAAQAPSRRRRWPHRGRRQVNPAAGAIPEAMPQAAATPGTRARIAVLGASGYTGQELTRLALAHPGIEVVALGSREHAGE